MGQLYNLFKSKLCVVYITGHCGYSHIVVAYCKDAVNVYNNITHSCVDKFCYLGARCEVLNYYCGCTEILNKVKVDCASCIVSEDWGFEGAVEVGGFFLLEALN